jgi:hypothetical protein
VHQRRAQTRQRSGSPSATRSHSVGFLCRIRGATAPRKWPGAGADRTLAGGGLISITLLRSRSLLSWRRVTLGAFADLFGRGVLVAGRAPGCRTTASRLSAKLPPRTCAPWTFRPRPAAGVLHVGLGAQTARRARRSWLAVASSAWAWPRRRPRWRPVRLRSSSGLVPRERGRA